VRQVDELPLANAVPARALAKRPQPRAALRRRLWWERWRDAVLEDARAWCA
jgi:hypothetical protein